MIERVKIENYTLFELPEDAKMVWKQEKNQPKPIKPFFAQLGSFMILAMFEILGSIFSFSPKKFTQFLTSGIL